MSRISSHEWKKKTEVVLHEDFYKNLDASSSTLRNLAQDMSDFLTPFNGKNPEIKQLCTTFQSLVNINITELDSGIDNIKTIFLKMDAPTMKKNKLPFNLKELEIFFNKQNHFDEELNRLLEYAIKIDDSSKS
ncbi:MAG: hypothetical protein K0U24_02385 [Gammaproteobacteria bacterium]|nr:hypothetical protein [Gammaproteobacteria bacterium]